MIDGGCGDSAADQGPTPHISGDKSSSLVLRGRAGCVSGFLRESAFEIIVSNFDAIIEGKKIVLALSRSYLH